ncbi:restriction endonuclease subunit S [Pseudomonas luteola]|uniref:Restriction endonuclease subunit S n=1 Tax=Pseudomonas luteola TaxID=47886 RepID=A0ABS0FRZ5_PSELU|nr:restriction endonuclease subunit S [Pseudomonas zeshuii]MBF8643072.1 restriction endonuclease subunit S [Pseudomonas zeshuii]
MSVAGKPGYQETVAGWIPVEWKAKFIGEMTDVSAGGTPSTNCEEYWNPPEVPWMSSGEVHLRRIYSTEKKISNLGLRNSAAKVFPKKSVVMALAGQGKTRGCVAVLESEVATNQSLAAIYPSEHFDTDFLFHNLNWRYQELRALSSGEGGRGGLNLSIIKAVPVGLPPLLEQQKIAAILTSVDDKLDVIARQIEATETLKKGLMQTLFSRGVGTQDANGRWVPHALFKESQLGKIPVVWEVSTQGNVAKFLNGRAYKLTEWEEEGTPVIRLQNLTGSGDKYYYSNLKLPPHQYVHNGDLLYMWSASFGPFIWQGEKAIYHYHIWKIECGEHLDKMYMYYSLFGLTEAMRGKTNGSTMMHLTKAGMERHSIALPPMSEQRRIAEILTGVDAKIDLLLSRQSHYQSLKRGLMQKLLTGEWRVKLDSPTEAA